MAEERLTQIPTSWTTISSAHTPGPECQRAMEDLVGRYHDALTRYIHLKVRDKNLADEWASDATFRAKYTRHMGGSNIGFADGHAKWFDAEAILFGGENWNGWGNDSDLIRGFGVCLTPTTKCCGRK